MSTYCVKVSVNICHFFSTNINFVIIYKYCVINIYVPVQLSNDILHDNWNIVRVITIISKNNEDTNLSMIMKLLKMQTHMQIQDSCIVVNTKSVANGRQY